MFFTSLILSLPSSIVIDLELSTNTRLTGSRIIFFVNERIGSKKINSMVTKARVLKATKIIFFDLLTGGIVNL